MSGDLSQMGTQRRVLNRHGVETIQSDVYPCIKQEDIPRAMKIIWDNRVEGWWHYESEYVAHSICSKEEFKTRLMR